MVKRRPAQEWLTNLGFVELDIEVGGSVKSVRVSHLHATLLLHVKDGGECVL